MRLRRRARARRPRRSTASSPSTRARRGRVRSPLVPLPQTGGRRLPRGPPPRPAGLGAPAEYAPFGGRRLGLRNAGFERRRERLTHRLELDPREHVLEEAANDQPLGLASGEATRHQIEELVAVDAPDRRAVRAADVV